MRGQAGSDGGAEHWAVIASLVETCKINDVDPLAYLADVLTKIVNGLMSGDLDASRWPSIRLTRDQRVSEASTACYSACSATSLDQSSSYRRTALHCCLFDTVVRIVELDSSRPTVERCRFLIKQNKLRPFKQK